MKLKKILTALIIFMFVTVNASAQISSNLTTAFETKDANTWLNPPNLYALSDSVFAFWNNRVGTPVTEVTLIGNLDSLPGFRLTGKVKSLTTDSTKIVVEYSLSSNVLQVGNRVSFTDTVNTHLRQWVPRSNPNTSGTFAFDSLFYVQYEVKQHKTNDEFVVGFSHFQAVKSNVDGALLVEPRRTLARTLVIENDSLAGAGDTLFSSAVEFIKRPHIALLSKFRTAQDSMKLGVGLQFKIYEINSWIGIDSKAFYEIDADWGPDVEDTLTTRWFMLDDDDTADYIADSARVVFWGITGKTASSLVIDSVFLLQNSIE